MCIPFLDEFNSGTANAMLVLSLLVTFVWWTKGFSNVSMEEKYFHWATLRFSHCNSANTVVKCSFTPTIRHMTRINKCHRVGLFFTGFSSKLYQALCFSTWLICTLHNSQCTILLIGYMLVQFQKPSPTYVQSMQPERFQLTNASFWSFSHHIYRFSTSYSLSSRSGNNSLLSSGVRLSVSDSSPSDSAMSTSLCCLLWKLQPSSFHCQ